MRCADKFTRRVEEPEIDTPSVESRRLETVGLGACLSESDQDLGIKTDGVPVEPAWEVHGPVREAMDFLQIHFPAVKTADYGASAGGTQIEGEIVFRCGHSGQKSGGIKPVGLT